MRPLRQHPASLAVSAMALLGWAGCDSPGRSSSRTEAKVSGLVTVLGKPATSGQISSHPANPARKDAHSVIVEIGKAGRYSAKPPLGRDMVIPLMTQVGRSADVFGARKTIEVTSGDDVRDIDLLPMAAANRPTARRHRADPGPPRRRAPPGGGGPGRVLAFDASSEPPPVRPDATREADPCTATDPAGRSGRGSSARSERRE